jgi:hypothetical protein
MYFYVSVELDQSIKTAENLAKAFKALDKAARISRNLSQKKYISNEKNQKQDALKLTF